MSTKNLSGECEHCGGRFEFPAAAAGVTGECPHCRQQTECLLASPPDEKAPAPTTAVIYTVVAVVILVGGLLGAFLALNRAQRLVAQQQVTRPSAGVVNPSRPAADPFAQIGFRVSPVTLEPASGTSPVYAQGTLVNTTNRQRLGVKVELDLFDTRGQWVAHASDYESVIELNAAWKFRALVVEPKAAAAKITAITESK